MYDNMDKKLKGAAKLILIGGAILFGIGGIANMIVDSFFVGLFVMVVGILITWISTWAMYSLGEVLENTKSLMDKVDQMSKTIANLTNQDVIDEQKNNRQPLHNTTNQSFPKSGATNYQQRYNQQQSTYVSAKKQEIPKIRKEDLQEPQDDDFGFLRY